MTRIFKASLLFLSGAGMFMGNAYAGGGCNLGCCPTCPPVIQHVYRVKHHHCAPPVAAVIPSMPMVGVAAAPAVATTAVAVQPQFAVAQQPVAFAQQQFVAQPATVMAVQPTTQFALVQARQDTTTGLDAETLAAVVAAVRARNNQTAQAPAAGAGLTLEERMTALETRLGRLETQTEKLVDSLNK